MPKTQMKRENLKPGEVLCQYCTAKCCRYFALPIDTPATLTDYEHIRWYMMHGPISMFVEDDTWYLMVHEDCKHLLPDNRCGVYDDRPTICREYTTVNCEYDDDTCYEKFFESPEQLWEYAEAVMPSKTKQRRRAVDGSQIIQLPVLSGSAP